MVIDFHVHCFPDELAKKAIPILADTAGVPARLDGTVGAVRNSMKHAKIDLSLVLSIATKPEQTQKINNWSVEIQKDGIISFGSIHPEYKQWESELNRIKSLGLKGLKLHPDYQHFFVDDKKMFPIYGLAEKLGLILVFHAGVDIGLPEPYHCTPDRLSKIIETFPDLKIVAAHMGGYNYWDDVEKFLVGKDIYFDTSFSVGNMEDSRVKEIINNHGIEKILFGTDSPWTDQSEETGKIKKLQLEGYTEKMIMGENARNLLNLA